MRILIFFFFSCWVYNLNAQTETEVIAPVDSAMLEVKSLAKAMISENSPLDRKDKCYKFIPALVNYLKQPNSFEIDLKPIEQISVLYAPDNSFRILTWAIEESITNTGNIKKYSSTEELIAEPLQYTYFGVIQLNQSELKLIPLTDKSAEINTPEDIISDAQNWYGCIYYNISQFNLNGQNCYALYGWDGNTGMSTRKIMEILSFKQDDAIFGMPIIEVFRDDTRTIKHRFVHEFRAGSGVSLNWDEERNMVVYDYIEAPDQESRGIYPTYVPDGTYNGLQFKNGMWRYVERVYEGFEISPEQLINDRETRKATKSQQPDGSKKKKKKRGRK